MKAMFQWARKNDILKNIPNIDAISRCKVIHQDRFTFNSEQINILLSAATIAARSGDPFAVQRLLGHANLTMATRYVQDVSAQTDRVNENNRRYICQIQH
jgi:integrase